MKLAPCVRFALALFVWVLLFSLKNILIIALAVFLHELAHFAVCCRLKIKVCSVTPLPWGLTLATPLIYSLRSQLLVSSAGPICNFVIFFGCIIIKKIFCICSYDFDFFILANLADGALNLLPALPLDGGVMLNSFLCLKKGLAGGFIKSMKITVITGALILLYGIQIFISTGYNLSYAAAGLFILLNLNHERELLMCIKKRVFTGEIKSAEKIRYVRADAGCSALCLANMISSSYSTVFLVNENGRFLGELTQDRMIKKLLECSYVTMGECIEKK